MKRVSYVNLCTVCTSRVQNTQSSVGVYLNESSVFTISHKLSGFIIVTEYTEIGRSLNVPVIIIASNQMEYLIRFVQIHESFRKPEVDALAALANVSVEVLFYSECVGFSLLAWFDFFVFSPFYLEQ